MRQAVIVSSVRTAVGKSGRGALATTRPDDLAATAIQGALARVPQLDPTEIEDVILGCAMPEAEQGMNVARIAALRAGLPVSSSAMTVNRFCASGLQSIAMAADRVRGGRSRGHCRRRHRVHEHGAHGRQQGQRQPLAYRPLRRLLPIHGAHRRARGPALRHRAASRRMPLPWQAIKKRCPPSMQGSFAAEIVPVTVT